MNLAWSLQIPQVSPCGPLLGLPQLPVEPARCILFHPYHLWGVSRFSTVAELTPPVHAVGASLVSCPLSVLCISPGCLLRCSLPGAREQFCPLDRTQASQHLHLSFCRGSLRKLSHSWSSCRCFVLVSLSRLCSLKPTLALVIFILFYFIF
mgnify:CR=1 FL=1